MKEKRYYLLIFIINIMKCNDQYDCNDPYNKPKKIP